MAGLQDFLFGSMKPVGSVSDVTMVNQSGYDDFMKQLNQAMGGFSGNLAGYSGQSGQGYQSVADMSQNYNNFVQNLLGGNGLYQSLAGATSNFSPTASMNSFLSQQGNLAQLANQNVDNALSGVYTSGRAQAQAAGDQSRRQAAGDLAAAGLLNTGAGVGAMTQATAMPIMEMETQLANMRSQALQNQLGQLQGQSAGLLGQGYGNAVSMAQAAQQLGLQGLSGQTGALEAGAAGQGNLAQLFGGLAGSGLQLGAGMNQPEYWQPSYQKTGGLTDFLTSIGTTAAGIGSMMSGGLGSGLASLFGGGGQPVQYTQYPWPQQSQPWQNAYQRTR